MWTLALWIRQSLTLFNWGLHRIWLWYVRYQPLGEVREHCHLPVVALHKPLYVCRSPWLLKSPTETSWILAALYRNLLACWQASQLLVSLNVAKHLHILSSVGMMHSLQVLWGEVAIYETRALATSRFLELPYLELEPNPNVAGRESLFPRC